MTTLRIGEKICGEGCEPLMFAEEGQANQGDVDLAVKMICHASQAGADGIEFQLFLAKDMYVQRDPGYALYLKNELDRQQIVDLIKAAHEQGLLFQAACLSPSLTDVCAAEGIDSFCVNASDLNNPYILDAVSATGLPFWLAALFATIEEIDWAVEHLLSRGADNFGLLHGQHVMSAEIGVPPHLVQLDCIPSFKKRYGRVVGFVDHTSTIVMPALAVAKGASIVMKHLSPVPEWKGPDHCVCLHPDDWRQSREMVRLAALASGDSKELSLAEIKDRSLMRRSLYTKQALPSGHVLSANDLVALRPGGGLDPREISVLAGKKTSHALEWQKRLEQKDIV